MVPHKYLQATARKHHADVEFRNQDKQTMHHQNISCSIVCLRYIYFFVEKKEEGYPWYIFVLFDCFIIVR